jgi:hypothetical protein
MWQEDNIIIFETKTKERGEVVLKGIYEMKIQAKL